MTAGELVAPRPRGRVHVLARALAREFGPAVGVGRRALLRHPVWTTTSAEGAGVGVVVVPGFGGSDPTMAVMRRWLARRGYRPVGAGLGLNVGCTAEMLDRLESRVEDHVRATGGPVVLVGHSRGGWLSRLVAVRRPDLVRGLVMFGSPVLDPLDARGLAMLGLRVLVRAAAFGVRGVLDSECVGGLCRDTTLAGLAAPLPVPAMAIYSREDGVVGWESCRDPHAEWVEVGSSHSGLGIDPDLYRAMAPRIAGWAARPGPAAAAS